MTEDKGEDFLEEYFAWEERQQAAVLQALAPEQRAIRWGGHFMRIWVVPGHPEMIAIFGRIYAWSELESVEDPETLATIKAQENLFLTARCYSMVEPDGEIGSVCRWDMWPIAPAQFEAAQRAGWNPADRAVAPWFRANTLEMLDKRGDIPDDPPPGTVISG